MNNRVDAFLEVAIEAVRAADAFLSTHEKIIVSSSIGHDIKLQADKNVETIILNVLQDTGINILSEEIGFFRNNSDTSLCWIIDPLDGSLNYARGIPLYCISIALWDGENPVLGVVYDCTHKNLYRGVIGKGAFLNDAQINVSQITRLSQAIIATGFPVYTSFDTETLFAFIQHLQFYKKVRLFGSAAFSMMMVAEGAVDAYRENNIAWWDVAAGIAITLAAGGYVEYNFTNREQYLMRVLALNNVGLESS
jgi:myo-inositol-1(or 4)-monophosphatase